VSNELPFSFPVDVVQLPAGGRTYKLAADISQRKAVAAHLGVEDVARLVATIAVRPASGGMVTAEGRFDADVTQACVVTLQPLPVTVGAEIERHYSAKASAPAKGKPADDDPEEGWVDPNEEPIDPIIDGRIDLGALVVEELSLVLDPYPRAPGVSFQGAGEKAVDLAVKESPFAALAGLGVKARDRRPPRDPSKGRRK
jgi:uncharacterized metal-binding protein YceD (DUF177 family)